MNFGYVWLAAQIASGLAWLAGLVLAQRGRWTWPYLAIAACALFNFGTIVSIYALPHTAFGEIGAGDGFGLIGLFIISAIALGACVAAAIVTAIFQAVRRPRHAVDQSKVA